MKKGLANRKIDQFFKAIAGKMSKTAAISNMENIDDAKMVSEMLTLPKYDALKDRLRGANGIVNLVTFDEYGPLIEVLLKTVYPPNSNATYAMDGGGGFFYINSKSFFGGDAIQGRADDNKWAQTVFDQVLMGTTKKKTLDWYKKELGYSNEEYEETMGQADAVDQYGNPVAQDPEVEAVVAYGKAIEAGEKDDIKISLIKKELREKSEELSYVGERGVVLPDTRKEEIRAEIKELTDTAKNIYVHKTNRFRRVERRHGEILTVRNPNGTAQRNDDGLIHFNPLSDISDAWGAIRDALKGKGRKWKPDDPIPEGRHPAIGSALGVFSQKLKDFHVEDDQAKGFKKQMIDTIGDGGVDEVNNFNYNAGRFAQLYNAFKDRIKGQGKTIIFDDFDYSPLCGVAGRSDLPHQIDDGGILANFLSSLSQVQAESRAKDDNPGNTSVILISKAPIHRLPTHTSVNMDSSPVDRQEAEIIVRNILDQYALEARQILGKKRWADLDKKFQGKTSFEDRADKKTEMKEINDNLIIERQNVGRVQLEDQEQLEQMISGMGQSQAINAVVNAVAASVTKEYEDNFASSLTIDGDKMIEAMRKASNDILSEDTLGISIKEPHIKFENYATKELSPWGLRVPELQGTIKSLAAWRDGVRSANMQLRRIDAEMDSKTTSTKGRESLLKERKMWLEAFDHYNLKRKEAMENLPNAYLLYGARGVGKSAWAEALCSLMGHRTLRDVDIGAQKDKWVGGTPKNAARLLKRILNSRDTVFIIDEIDRQMEMEGSDSGTTQGGHETTKDLVKRFLDFFELAENQSMLKENGIYVVITTNFIDNVDMALSARIGEKFEVFRADRPQDYKKLLGSFFDTLRSKRPNNPIWIGEGVTTPEGGWDSSIKFFYENIDIDVVANKLSEKSIDYRTVERLMVDAIKHHYSWDQSVQRVGNGDGSILSGLPITTQNMVQAIEFADAGNQANSDQVGGLIELMLVRKEQLEKMMAGRELEMTEVDDLILKDEAGNPVKKNIYVIPDDVNEFMRGEVTAEGAPIHQLEYGEKGFLSDRTPQQEMEDLVGGFDEGQEQDQPVEDQPVEDQPVEDQSVEVEQTRRPSKTKKKNGVPEEEEEVPEEDKEAQTMSDYLYKYLQDEGLLNKEGQLQQSPEQAIPIKPSNNKGDISDGNEGQPSRFTEGVYNFGFVLIAPATADTPSQRIKEDLNNGDQREEKRN